LEGKYILNLTGRRDGSSRFDLKQFATLALGAAWIFSNENFLNSAVSWFGKLRVKLRYHRKRSNWDHFLDTHTNWNSYQGMIDCEPISLFNPEFDGKLIPNLKLLWKRDLKDRLF
jgi:hypothetical protein